MFLTPTSQIFIYFSINDTILLTFYSTNALNLLHQNLTNALLVYLCATAIQSLPILVIMICGQIHATVTLQNFSSRPVVSETTYVLFPSENAALHRFD